MNLNRRCIEEILHQPSMQQYNCDYLIQVIQVSLHSKSNDNEQIRLFVWDGELYSSLFFLLSKRSDNEMKKVVAGDVIRVTSLMTSGNAKTFVILNSFSVVRNFTYILHTPLSLQTLPKDLTMRSFERYVAPVRCLTINYPEPNSSILQTTVNRSDLLSSSSENLSFPSFKSSSDNSFTEKRLYSYLLLFVIDASKLPLIQMTINR